MRKEKPKGSNRVKQLTAVGIRDLGERRVIADVRERLRRRSKVAKTVSAAKAVRRERDAR